MFKVCMRVTYDLRTLADNAIADDIAEVIMKINNRGCDCMQKCLITKLY